MDSDSESSVRSMDKDEYLVDIKCGMDVEYMMASVGDTSGDHRLGMELGGLGELGKFGYIEIRKRKHPAGGAPCTSRVGNKR